jgi:putative phosphoesterase
MRVAIVSDTHLPRRGSHDLPSACLAEVRAADLLVHAGDLADLETLGMLRAIGPPVVAVHGNSDQPAVRAALPATASVDLPGLRLAVTHDGGQEAGRLARLRRRFPDAGAVVFGHSHLPLLAGADGFLILNPGSPTDRRRAPRHSMAVIEVEKCRPPAVHFLAVDDPAGPLPPELVRTSA